MIFIDTHAHLYLSSFDSDRNEVINRAISNGVKYMLLPNIDAFSASDVLSVCDTFSENCFPLLGLHPTDVKDDWQKQLEKIIFLFNLNSKKIKGIGETGIDMYWDTSFVTEQQQAFNFHVNWSIETALPLVIHCRESHDAIIDILLQYKNKEMLGVFHCFGGSYKQASEILDLGFYIGIGGAVTYKNSKLPETLRKIGLANVVLETDAPFLSPVPFRGKRNESSYVPYIAKKIALIFDCSIEHVSEITTKNAKKLFNIP